jgi:ubiquinone/menaquinone biosynthesis C-methylase UbiE
MDKQTKELYRKVAKVYHDFRVSGKAVVNEQIINPAALKALGSVKGKRVLDLGCGTGIISLKLKKRGAKVSGIDLSPDMIEIARSYAKGIEFKVGPAEKLPYKAGYFDATLALLVFDYIKDIDRALREVWRVTKRGGYFVIAMRNPIATASSKVRIRGRKLDSTSIRKFDRYFVERQVAHQWWTHDKRLKVTEYDLHRTYQTIIRAFIRNGFTIVDYIDPKMVGSTRRRHPRWYNKLNNNLPQFCVFKLRRT